jgi:hypothetical protein
MALAQERHLGFFTLPYTGVLSAPLLTPEWHYLPFSRELRPLVKPKAIQRIHFLFEHGVGVKSLVIGEEVKKELHHSQRPAVPRALRWAVLAAAAAGVAYTAAQVAALFTVAAVDPQVICVLDDRKETWLCIHSCGVPSALL